MAVGTSSRICRAGVQTVYWRFVPGNSEKMIKTVKTLIRRPDSRCPTGMVESHGENVLTPLKRK